MSTEQVAAAEPAPPGRIERKRGRRIQEILATAAALFGERGYEAVSLEDVADRLDVTKGSLYYYFASKDELVTAAIETLGNEWTARLEGLPAGQSGTAAERLHALVREHIGIAVREYPAALGLFLAPQDFPAAQQARIKELRRRHERGAAVHARGDVAGPRLVRAPLRAVAGPGDRRLRRHRHDARRRSAASRYELTTDPQAACAPCATAGSRA